MTRNFEKTAGIILAGGFGSRMSNFKDIPKILLNEPGLFDLAYNHIEGMRNLDVDEIIFVTGYKAEEVEREIRSRISDLDNVHFVPSNLYHLKKNIYSIELGIRTAREKNSKYAYMVMGDHLLPYKTIAKTLKNFKKEECIIEEIIDTGMNYMLPENSTRVLTEENLILESGKKLENYNGLDIGFFMLNVPITHNLIAEGLRKGEKEWNSVINSEAYSLNMKFNTIVDIPWFGLNNKEQYKNAINHLLKMEPSEYFFLPETQLELEQSLTNIYAQP